MQLDFRPGTMTFVPVKPSAQPEIDKAVAKAKKERRAKQTGITEITGEDADEDLPF